MKENNHFNEIYDKLKKCKTALISTHTAPDGDSYGSCLAMKYFLERDLNYRVKLISPDIFSDNIQKLPYTKGIEFNKDISQVDLLKFDLLILMDSDIMCETMTYVMG